MSPTQLVLIQVAQFGKFQSLKGLSLASTALPLDSQGNPNSQAARRHIDDIQVASRHTSNVSTCRSCTR